jgi:PKD repeat protein
MVGKMHSMVKRTVFLFLLLTVYLCDTRSQISEPGEPESFQITTKASAIIPEKVLDVIDTGSLLAEEVQRNIPDRYGVVQQLEIDIKKDGVKTSIPGRGTIWQYKIQSQQAYSLGIHFIKYLVPPEAKVFVYDETHSNIAGAFTSNNNNYANQLAIAEFKGENAIIEYFEPLEASFAGELMIGYVSQAYKDILKASTLRVGINCPEGSNWQDVKHAICRMSFHDDKYSYLCSGFLVNNVREDGKPYFQTANHCISDNTMATTLITYFNYENSTCSNSNASTSQTLSGATLKATNSYSDFTLLLLNEFPSAAYFPYYAGWDVSSRSPQSGSCIHHPEGTPKCISLDLSAPKNYPNSLQWVDENNVVTNTTAGNTHWNAVFDDGGIESGSSGSPLFDDNQRAIGQLHGGSATNTYFGKSSVSWNHSASGDQQLKYWLDPDNSGTLAVDGTYMMVKPQASFSTSLTRVCIGTPVIFTDKSKYSPRQWNWKVTPSSFAFVNGSASNSENPQITFNNTGTYTISLTVTNINGTDSVTKTNYIAAGQNISVSLSGITADSIVCGCNLINYPFNASGALNYNFTIERADKIDYVVRADSAYLSLKSVERKNGSFNSWVKVTGTFGTCISTDSALLKVIMPPNDDIANATRLHPGSNNVYSNFCGSVEKNEPQPSTSSCYANNSWCSASTLKNTIWFTFLGPANGKISLDTHGFNDCIAVYKADSYDNILSGHSSAYQVIAANDDRSTEDATALIENLSVEPFKTYWLQINGFNGATGDVTVDLISNSLELYPNPTNGTFTLVIADENDGVAELKIFSQVGQLFYDNRFEVTKASNRFNFDLSSYDAGMYILEAKINGNTSKAKLIIVK